MSSAAISPAFPELSLLPATKRISTEPRTQRSGPSTLFYFTSMASRTRSTGRIANAIVGLSSAAVHRHVSDSHLSNALPPLSISSRQLFHLHAYSEGRRRGLQPTSLVLLVHHNEDRNGSEIYYGQRHQTESMTGRTAAIAHSLLFGRLCC